MNKNILLILIGIVIGLSTAVVAATYNAKQINFNPSDSTWKVNNVKDAIDDLKKTKGEAVEVARLTTPGATYTMQNDGYILGNVSMSSDNRAANIWFNEYNNPNYLVYYGYLEDTNMKVSLYAPKGTVIYTRNDYGIYNLIIYEWK